MREALRERGSPTAPTASPKSDDSEPDPELQRMAATAGSSGHRGPIVAPDDEEAEPRGVEPEGSVVEESFAHRSLSLSSPPAAPQEEAPEDEPWDEPWDEPQDEGDGYAGPPDDFCCGDLQFVTYTHEELLQRQAGGGRDPAVVQQEMRDEAMLGIEACRASMARINAHKQRERQRRLGRRRLQHFPSNVCS